MQYIAYKIGQQPHSARILYHLSRNHRLIVKRTVGVAVIEKLIQEIAVGIFRLKIILAEPIWIKRIKLRIYAHRLLITHLLIGLKAYACTLVGSLTHTLNVFRRHLVIFASVDGDSQSVDKPPQCARIRTERTAVYIPSNACAQLRRASSL